MDKQLFRKKNIDKVTSPEQLNDYIKVSNPGVWMVLVAIILLLVGVCVWGIFGRLDTTIIVGGKCENGTITCYVKESEIQKIQSGMEIDVNGNKYKISSVASSPVAVDDSLESYILHIGNLQSGEWVYPITASCDLDSGTYKAVVTVESVSPMTFVLN